MPVSLYRLFGRTESSRSSSLAELWDVGVMAQAKRSDTNPYEIANESIALRLGEALNLPIPPGVVVAEAGQTYFCSMFFGSAGHKLPPANTEKIAMSHAPMATAILLFDCWICNPDRHDENISLNETTNEITLFDHGVALFGEQGDGYENYQSRLCIENHCIAEEIRAFTGFDDWLERICDLPKWLVREIVQDSQSLGVTRLQAEHLSLFLLSRRNKLRTLFHDQQNDRSVFPRKQSSLFGIRGESYGDIDYYCI